MKLAFCLYKYFPYGGLQVDFLRIAQACYEKGHYVTVFTLAWQGEKPQGFEIIEIAVSATKNHKRYQEFRQKLTPLLAQGDYDVVIGFNKMPDLDVYYAADPCYEEKARTLRPFYYRWTPRYRHFSAYEHAVFDAHLSTKILALSKKEMGHFIKYYQTPASRFYPLPPNIRKDRQADQHSDKLRAEFRQQFHYQSDDNILLMIGSDFKRKGLDRSLIALASLPEALKVKTYLFVVGKDKGQAYYRFAQKLGVKSQLTILEGSPNVPLFLQGCDLLLHPAYSENTGTVLLEGLVAGLPVLCSGTCGFAHYIEEAEAGLVLTEPFQQAEMNQLLPQMLEDKSARQTWRENGIAYGQTHDLYGCIETSVAVIEQTGQERNGQDN